MNNNTTPATETVNEYMARRTAEKQAIAAALDAQLGKRVALSCQVGVCIWGEMFTLEPGRGLCQYDCVRDGMRIGISSQIVSAVKLNLDGTLAITIS